MDDSLFTVELPFVSTDEELEKVKAMYPKYDSYFIASSCIKERKEKFDKFSSEILGNVCWKCAFG